MSWTRRTLNYIYSSKQYGWTIAVPFTDFMYKYGYMWSLIESGVYIHYFIITDYDLLE